MSFPMFLQVVLTDAAVPAQIAHVVPNPQVLGCDVMLEGPTRRPHKTAKLAIPPLVHRFNVGHQSGLVAGPELALVACVQSVKFMVGLSHVLLDQVQILGFKVAVLAPQVHLKCN